MMRKEDGEFPFFTIVRVGREKTPGRILKDPAQRLSSQYRWSGVLNAELPVGLDPEAVEPTKSSSASSGEAAYEGRGTPSTGQAKALRELAKPKTLPSLPAPGESSGLPIKAQPPKHYRLKPDKNLEYPAT